MQQWVLSIEFELAGTVGDLREFCLAALSYQLPVGSRRPLRGRGRFNDSRRLIRVRREIPSISAARVWLPAQA